MNKKVFTVFLSHDVDHTEKQWFHYFYYLLKQKRWFHLFAFFSAINPYWCFDEIMALERRLNVKSTFFFLNESIKANILQPKTWNLAVGRYRFTDEKVRDIMRKIYNGGWEIGLHGSYNSFTDVNLVKKEKKSLEKALGHRVFGIRQHHLNLKDPETWQHQREAGFIYDSSFGFKNKVGFKKQRYQPFFPFDDNFMVIPLALMDGNVLDCHYVVNETNEAKIWRRCLKIINEAQKKKAVLSVLWHSRFFAENDFPGCAQLYEKIILECQKRKATFLTGKEIWKQQHGN